MTGSLVREPRPRAMVPRLMGMRAPAIPPGPTTSRESSVTARATALTSRYATRDQGAGGNSSVRHISALQDALGLGRDAPGDVALRAGSAQRTAPDRSSPRGSAWRACPAARRCRSRASGWCRAGYELTTSASPPAERRPQVSEVWRIFGDDTPPYLPLTAGSRCLEIDEIRESQKSVAAPGELTFGGP